MTKGDPLLSGQYGVINEQPPTIFGGALEVSGLTDVVEMPPPITRREEREAAVQRRAYQARYED